MIGWLDCAAGASGDMFLGALVDAGVPLETLQASVDALGVEPVRLSASATTRHGLAAVKVDVDCPDSDVDRRYPAIRDLIAAADLPRRVREAAVDVFTRLGRAEAVAHRTSLEQVHFHEVGALDSLADVTAACAGLHWLAEHRGLDRLSASTVVAGGGTTRGAHGGIPLPAPATLAVLSHAGAPVAGEVPYEACT
ncbi:MAG: LarC family nickel insertion protein, partial [Stackebrandtia sp.]